jgi:hypothetical protein
VRRGGGRLALVLAALWIAGCHNPRRAGAKEPGASTAPTPPVPTGPHPRIALTKPLLATLRQNAKRPDSQAARALRACQKADPHPGLPDGYQGNEWAFAASACALAYQMTGDAGYAAKGVKFWRALLEDVSEMGDRKACLPGADRAHAIASVRRDTGYAIRHMGPHTALAYDWLHDAPGVDEALRAQSRACMTTWMDWYTKEGYLRTQPGSNYQAGYVFAKTLISIATGGEAGEAAARFWRETINDVYGDTIVRRGLAGGGGGPPLDGRDGVMVGGDWMEGWQYGTLSVVELAFCARLLEEHGARLPAMHAWADSVTLRFLHGMLPARNGLYVGGDTETEAPDLEARGGPLVATVLGPGSDRVAGWAAFLGDALHSRYYGTPMLDALTEARAVVPADPLAGGRPLWYLARGTSTLYARSAWTPSAFWAVFTSSPRQVPDHQHVDATNFVFSRGPDRLVVDPTPYGSRSSMSSNALTVDADVVEGDYKPSQTPWSGASLPWARATASGVAAARGDITHAFDYHGTDSDVPLARRDWVFLPEGEIVAIDRARLKRPTHQAYLRFRTVAPLVLQTPPSPSGEGLARGDVGGSSIVIHAVTLSPPPVAGPAIVGVPKADDCPGSFGACGAARFPVNEYNVKLRGAAVLAVHVLDGIAIVDKPSRVLRLDSPEVDVERGGNKEVVGAAVLRGLWTYVVAAAEARADAPRSLAYVVPGAAESRHVVFDAPGSDAREGRTSVSAAAAGAGCRVTLSSSGGRAMPGRPAIFRVGPSRSGCAVTEEADAPPDDVTFPRAAAR